MIQNKKGKQPELRVAYRQTIKRRFTVLRTVTLTVTLTLAIITPPLNIPPLPYGTVVSPTAWDGCGSLPLCLAENIERIKIIRLLSKYLISKFFEFCKLFFT